MYDRNKNIFLKYCESATNSLINESGESQGLKAKETGPGKLEITSYMTKWGGVMVF